jgi:hypothetical protein
MAEYIPRSGYNPGVVGSASGSEPPDTIEAQWIRKLERDLWVRFWGPGVACSDWTGTGETEYDRATGWNQSATYSPPGSASAAGMGDLSGNPDSHISAGSGISTSDPRDATGYGKYTVRPNITDATQADPCRITCIAHGLLHDSTSGTPHDDSTLSVPNKIQIVGVPATSMHELNCDNVNNQFFYAKVIDNDTLDLYTDATHASGVTTFNTSYDSSGNSQWAGSIGYVNFVVDFEELSGDMSTGNYERTTSIARDQYIAIQQRINAAIKHTGQSTFVQGDITLGLLDLVQTKSMYKSVDTETTDINEDMGRVRDDHVNAMSAEIEHVGAPLNITSLGSYNFHKLHVHGIYAPYSMNEDDDSVYSDDLTMASGSLASTHAWGSDTWNQSYNGLPWPWSASGGTDYGNDRPFIEARMTFLDWPHLRYWFNQGGCCTFWPHYNSNGSWGGNMWAMLARANEDSNTSKVFAGQYTPYHENAALISSGLIGFTPGGSGNGWGVTGDCPRVHGFGDKANAYFSGSGGATSNGTTITVSSTTNMAPNDILHLGVWIGDIETITDSTTVELYRNIRQIGGTVYDNATHGNLSGLAWACSKWYRACQYNGAASLYGTDTSGTESANGDGGWIHYDWRFVKDPNQLDKPCIFYRMMYDNAGTNCTVHGEGTLRLGSRWPDPVGYFWPEQYPPTVIKDNASTAEGFNGMWRT